MKVSDNYHSILGHQEYDEGINHIIENLDTELSPLSKWESFKSQVKEFSICFLPEIKRNGNIKFKI